MDLFMDNMNLNLVINIIMKLNLKVLKIIKQEFVIEIVEQFVDLMKIIE